MLATTQFSIKKQNKTNKNLCSQKLSCLQFSFSYSFLKLLLVFSPNHSTDIALATFVNVTNVAEFKG